jgi:hypothetical protein
MLEANQQLPRLTPDERRQRIYDDKYPRVILNFWDVPKKLNSLEGIRYMAVHLLNEGPIYQHWIKLGFVVSRANMEECIEECDTTPQQLL